VAQTLDLSLGVLDVPIARWATWKGRKGDGPMPLDRPITFFRLTGMQEEQRRQLLEEALGRLLLCRSN